MTVEIILIGSVAFFVLCQVFNAFINLMTARYMKKQMVLQGKIKEDESRLLFEEWERISLSLKDIQECLHNFDLRFQHQRDLLESIEDEVIIISKIINPKEKPRARGKYKPRKPKTLEHKEKTPS